MNISVKEHPKYKVNGSQIENAVSQERSFHNVKGTDETYASGYNSGAKNARSYLNNFKIFLEYKAFDNNPYGVPKSSPNANSALPCLIPARDENISAGILKNYSNTSSKKAVN